MSDLTETLRAFEGRRLTRLTRHSWWSVKQAAAECAIPETKAFSLTCGPLELEFDGSDILMLASDPGENSIVAWNDRDAPSGDEEVDYLIPANDPTGSEPYWARLRNREVRYIEILKPSAPSPKVASRRSEVGVIFWLGGYGSNLIASHGLHDGSDDFSVLRRRDLSSKTCRSLVATRLSGEGAGRQLRPSGSFFRD